MSTGDERGEEDGVRASDDVEQWNDGEAGDSSSDEVGAVEAGDVMALAGERRRRKEVR